MLEMFNGFKELEKLPITHTIQKYRQERIAMERLNKALVPQVKRPQNIRVMQFGEGGFLRAFVDEMLDNLNTQCGGYYGVAILQPLERGMC